MEQVDRGYLILNKGDKEKPKSKHSSNKEGRLLSNKGSEDEDHDGLGDDEERLDWVFKVLERYQITLEKVGPVSNQGPTSCRSSSRSTADVFKQAVECPTVHVGGDWDLGWTTEWDRMWC
ncbi:hypothetical protein BY996DRAFT_6437433 [Phakopsora pachyrhizi]|nr:hypothetical protein BY996DRAFT_6437433 [Phakopsora pachyrhizi]